MKKHFVAVGMLAVTLAGASGNSPAQTYGEFTYGDPSGYGNNAYLNAAITRRQKFKARSSKRSHRKRPAAHRSRSRRHSRRS